MREGEEGRCTESPSLKEGSLKKDSELTKWQKHDPEIKGLKCS